MRGNLILLTALLFFIIVSSGCIQVSSQTRSCSSSSGALGVSYDERTYLWGDDGLMTKRYDATFYALGFPQVKTGISEYELNSYRQLYCYQAKTTQTPVKTTVPTIRTPTPVPTHKITDGYWCQESMWYVENVQKNVRDCYQFLPDGGANSGSSATPLPMNRMERCHTNNNWTEVCSSVIWRVNSRGQYEIMGDVCGFDGYILNCPNLGTYKWSVTGI